MEQVSEKQNFEESFLAENLRFELVN